MGKPPIDIVVRAEVDAYTISNDNEVRFILLKTFNQENNFGD